MTLGELFGLEAKLPEGLSRLPISGLAADSREVQPGFLFAALPGMKTDGQRFIASRLTTSLPDPIKQIHVVLNWAEELQRRVPANGAAPR